jgi:1,4-dihydroxy-2-naphthoyl-CoA hydrolase
MSAMDPWSLPTPIPLDRSFDSFLGIDYQRLSGNEVSATVTVRDELLDRGGNLHGGVISATAEAIASLGTGAVVWEQGYAALGMSIGTTFFKPVSAGTLLFVARRVSQMPDLWIWQVEARDHEDELCAMSTVSVAVRPQPAGPPEESLVARKARR